MIHRQRPFVLHTYIAERIVLPIVLAFAAGVLIADVMYDASREQQRQAMRVAIERQLALECSPVYAPVAAEARP